MVLQITAQAGMDGWMGGRVSVSSLCRVKPTCQRAPSSLFSQMKRASRDMDIWGLLPATCRYFHVYIRAIQPLELDAGRREYSRMRVFSLGDLPDSKCTICTHTCSFMTGLDSIVSIPNPTYLTKGKGKRK
jgi:hypothetical protein